MKRLSRGAQVALSWLLAFVITVAGSYAVGSLLPRMLAP